MEENKISVVINTYNAEEFLQQVIDSVKEFDEIVICDMESTDHTVEIAQRNGCRVVTFPKGNHKSAEPARTFAIQSATSKWVLVVDADELISPELRQYLYRRITEPDCPAGLYLFRRNKFIGKYGRDWSHDYQLRFFIREGTVWPPYVHTFPEVQGRVERAPVQYAIIHLADESIRYGTNALLYELMCGSFDIKSNHYREDNSLASDQYRFTLEQLTAMNGRFNISIDANDTRINNKF